MLINRKQLWIPKGLDGIKLATKETIDSMTPFQQSRLVYPHHEATGPGLYEEVESPLMEYAKHPRYVAGLSDKEYAAWLLNAGGYADAGTLPEVTVRPPLRYMQLTTYYPIISKRYSLTGHSELRTPYGYISKNGNDAGYNLFTNNCSDATLNALNYIFNKSEDTNFFTTPGDTRDFARTLGGFEDSERTIDGDGLLVHKYKTRFSRKHPTLHKMILETIPEKTILLIPITTAQLKRVHDAYEQNRKDNSKHSRSNMSL